MMHTVLSAATFAGHGGFHGGFHGGPRGFSGPMMGGYDSFAGHMGSGHYGATLFGSHLGGLAVLVAIGIAVWFFATGRHRGPQLAAAYAPAAAPAAMPAAAPAVTPAAAPFAASATLDPAEKIARERLARGEIDAEQYGVIIATLRNRA